MIKVQVRPNEPLESALRRFKRQCNYAGIFRLAKKYSFFEKRSDKRRREGRERLRSIQRAMRKGESSGQRGRGRRRSKMRTSSVTPESARLAAEAAVTPQEAEPAITPETVPAPQPVDTTAVAEGVPGVSSPQQAES